MAHTPQAQQETQKAALRYERAVSMHNAAREMVFVAEQGVMADKNRLDPTWQEMLNHATCKVPCTLFWAPGALQVIFLRLRLLLGALG